jgi:AraC-like DNA-binding protein
MVMQPLCEPVSLPIGLSVLVAQVNMPAEAPQPGRLLHFHDVAEIVLFGQASGQFICDQQSFPITPGCAVFVPTMLYHDYQFDPGPKAWTLIQVEPYLVEQLTQGWATPTQPICVQPDTATVERLQLLANWLGETARADPADPLIERLTEMILALLGRQPSVAGRREPGAGQQLARFLPAIERLRRAPGNPLSLNEAARLCHLSPAYFSRRFTAIFRCGFSDYVTAYRLHLASREIATTAKPLAEIAYTLGFCSHSHFTAQFRRRFGLSPRQYRTRLAERR